MTEPNPINEAEEREETSAALTSDADPRTIAARIEEMPPADGADVLTHLPIADAAEVAEYLDHATAADILTETDPVQAALIVDAMHPPEAAMVLGAMDPDDRVDVLDQIPAELRENLIGELKVAERAQVRTLQQYPPDTAGGIMTTQVTSLPEHMTVEQAIEELRRLNEQLEQMFYVYVVDIRGHLVGVLSMRDLILAKPETKISSIMRTNVQAVPAHMDQEEVARIVRRLKYLAMPVVDAKNRLVGLITVDDVVDVINEEATEDVQKMAGAGAEERLNSPWHFSFRMRVPWLGVNLGTAFLAAWVVGLFEETIRFFPILAAYQTVVSGMGGNAGAQAMAVTIRGIALGQVDTGLLKRLIRRELIVGVLTGIIIGLITWAICAATRWDQRGLQIGAIICAALIINHINANLSGVLIPFVMRKLGFDPAQSATIFATTFTDCGGFLITLGLATIFLSP
jgi:magnesium transporter